MGFEAKAEKRAAERAKTLPFVEEDQSRWWRNRMDLEQIAEKRAAAWAKILPDLEEDCRQAYLQGLEEEDIPEDLKLELREEFKLPEDFKLQFLKEFEMESMLRGEVRLHIREEFKMPPRKKKSSMSPRNKSLIAIGTMLSTGAVLLISGFLVPGMSLSKSFRIVCWQTATVSFFAAWLAVDFGSPRLPLWKAPC